MVIAGGRGVKGDYMVYFYKKLLDTQHSVGGYTGRSPIMKWANSLKESSKKITEAKHSLSHHHHPVH